MIQGTGSDVGKSLLVAGLCRAFRKRGLKVRPFKPQNMSNNAAVTMDGGEIGRAQALQARACDVEPSVHMNPVLLKPESEKGAQLIVQGKHVGRTDARTYTAMKADLLDQVIESYEINAASANLVVIEGAGSPAEINLREGDIANMGFALAIGTPVLLIADIERGGVIASLVGTYELLTDEERRQVVGYVVNKFRGDVSLFDAGVTEIGRRTGWSCFGVLPFFQAANRLPAEDAVRLSTPQLPQEKSAIKVVVPVLSRIANFDDLDPLMAEADVSVEFIRPGAAFPGDADLIVLPGSKSTRADIDMVRAQGWDIDISAHLRRGGWVLGLCGGYQMLGRCVTDPGGVEGPSGSTEGLGLLDVETIIAERKTLKRVEGVAIDGEVPVKGYEIHMGRTTGPDAARPMIQFQDRADGAISVDGKVMGCYLHGLFAADGFRSRFLNKIRRRNREGASYEQTVEATLDGLADHLESHLDIDRLWQVTQNWAAENSLRHKVRTNKSQSDKSRRSA
jgi:adenosylcobyric acid synthase